MTTYSFTLKQVNDQGEELKDGVFGNDVKPTDAISVKDTDVTVYISRPGDGGGNQGVGFYLEEAGPGPTEWSEDWTDGICGQHNWSATEFRGDSPVQISCANIAADSLYLSLANSILSHDTVTEEEAGGTRISVAVGESIQHATFRMTSTVSGTYDPEVEYRYKFYGVAISFYNIVANNSLRLVIGKHSSDTGSQWPDGLHYIGDNGGSEQTVSLLGLTSTDGSEFDPSNVHNVTIGFLFDGIISIFNQHPSLRIQYTMDYGRIS